MITTVFVLGFITSSQLNSFFVVDAQDGSNNGQSENIESVLPDMGLDNSSNSTLSNFSLPTVSSSEDVVSDTSNFTQNNTAEQPTIADENVTAPEENTTVPQEPTIADENVTAPEENTTVPQEPTIADENVTAPEENTTVPQEPTIADENVTTSEPSATVSENVTTSELTNNTNNNTSPSNVTTTNVAPVEGVDIINSDSSSSADQALPAEQRSADNMTSANIAATTGSNRNYMMTR